MEAKKETQPSIFDQLKEYYETRLKLAKYQAIEGGTTFVASVVTDIVIVISAILAFIFATITLAYFLGDLLGGTWKGFGIISLIYLIIVVMLKYKRQSLEKPIINVLIQKILKN